MVNDLLIAVVADSTTPEAQRAAADLAAQLGLPIQERAKPQATLVLAVSDERLELREPETRPGRGLSVDFSSLNPRQASSRGGFSRRQPLARAIGKATQTALDATAGLGHDAALLACMGYRVTAVERSPIIAALLRDGLRRAMNNPALHEHLRDHLRIINTDARDVLRTQTTQPDAVYIDPMFPPKRKASALARKSVRLVRQIVGEDEDAADLLAVARQHAGRVVVKRPTYAPPLAAKPTMSFTGKLVRYDVYLTNA